MLTYDAALAAILDIVHPLETESLPLERAHGRVLAEALAAPFDLPPFHNSAVDGYAVRVTDVASPPVTLPVTATVQAGDVASSPLAPGTSARIYTGAPMPDGAEAVVMREQCDDQGATVVVKRSARLGENVRQAGEEFRAGDEVLPVGARLTPPVVGMAATLGRSQVRVHRLPCVSVLSTGNELVAPGEPLPPGRIYESNAYGLAAALTALGLDPPTVARVPDHEAATETELARCLLASDVVITLGGVSVGDYDFVRAAAERLGIQEVFWRVAIKPGKPVYFGVYGHRTTHHDHPATLVFGLPGNPVSALVCYHQFVKPALLRLMGLRDVRPRRAAAILEETLRCKPGRLEWVRATLAFDGVSLRATPLRGQGSHMLGGLARADALILVPADAACLEAGSMVQVQWLEWSR